LPAALSKATTPTAVPSTAVPSTAVPLTGFWGGFEAESPLNLTPNSLKLDTRLKDEMKEQKLQVKDLQQQLLKANNKNIDLEKRNKGFSAELSTVKQQVQSLETKFNGQETHMQMLAGKIQGLEQFFQQRQN
jgi:phage-related tail protein